MNNYLDHFVDAYVECALWSSTTDEEDPLDAYYGRDDIAPDALAKMREDCADFVNRTSMQMRRNWTPEQAGHDFWLTRNGHGAGFWDRGQPDGDELSRYAEEYGSCDLYIGTDDKVYL
jgi:hypothetical protein